MKLSDCLKKPSQVRSHFCPRQILGIRLGLLGLKALGFDSPPPKKRLLVVVETDGCFADGVIAATGCAVGHRTLRLEDYGKTAAVFVDTVKGRALRVAPALDVRQKAYAYAPHETRRYFAQMTAYQIMPDDKMFTVALVSLKTPIESILSRPGLRVNCDVCGEEIMNEREVKQDALTLCRACAGVSYYTALQNLPCPAVSPDVSFPTAGDVNIAAPPVPQEMTVG